MPQRARVRDFYVGCIAEVLGIAPEDVTPLQREQAKQFSFSARLVSPFVSPPSDEERRASVIDVLTVMREALR